MTDRVLFGKLSGHEVSVLAERGDRDEVGQVLCKVVRLMRDDIDTKLRQHPCRSDNWQEDGACRFQQSDILSEVMSLPERARAFLNPQSTEGEAQR